MNVKHLLTAVLLLTTAVVTAQTTERRKSAISKVQIDSFYKLVINASIDVLLIEDNEPGILYIEGDKDFFDDISIKQENGVLTIESSKDRSYKNKIYIGLPVKNLAAIDINAQSFVSGMNALQSKELVITLNEECLVNLQSTGKIEIKTMADIGYSFQKKLPREYMNRPWK